MLDRYKYHEKKKLDLESKGQKKHRLKTGV